MRVISDLRSKGKIREEAGEAKRHWGEMKLPLERCYSVETGSSEDTSKSKPQPVHKGARARNTVIA